MPKEKDTSWSSGHRYSRKELLEVFSRLAAIGAIQDPIKALEHKIAKKEWFEGVMMAATLLESIGMARLKAHLKGKISWKKIERLSFEQSIMFLYGIDLIGPQSYSKIMEIRDERNKLAHRVYDKYILGPEKAEKLIRKAIECFKDLGFEEKV